MIIVKREVMRGKKIDTEFVTNYIASCALNNKIDMEDIALQAEKDITEIDLLIKETENLKKKRSKLIDVVSLLKTKNKNVSKDINILNFYKVKNINLALNFCILIDDKPQTLDFLKNLDGITDDKNFVMKELLDLSILKRNNNFIEKGILFDEFMAYAKGHYNL